MGSPINQFSLHLQQKLIYTHTITTQINKKNHQSYTI